MGVIGAPQMASKRVSSILLGFHCPLGLGELWACSMCSFPDVVFPTLFLSALSSSPFNCALQDGFGHTDERNTCPHHCSLRLFTIVRWSSCGPIACWILARTSLLVAWSLYEMCVVSSGSTLFPWLLFFFGALL